MKTIRLGYFYSFSMLDAMHARIPIASNRKNPKPKFHPCIYTLVHLSDQSIDLILAVSEITTLYEMTELAGSETSSWVGELEWPEEVGGLLEVGADSEDLVDQIFHADNAVLAKRPLDDGVVGESNALLLNLSVSTLVDELTDGLQVGVSISDPWLDNLEHFKGGLGHANKDTIVDLKETEELENLAGLWCNLVDTRLLLETNSFDR